MTCEVCCSHIINLNDPSHGFMELRGTRRYFSTETCLPRLELFDFKPTSNSSLSDCSPLSAAHLHRKTSSLQCHNKSVDEHTSLGYPKLYVRCLSMVERPCRMSEESHLSWACLLRLLKPVWSFLYPMKHRLGFDCICLCFSHSCYELVFDLKLQSPCFLEDHGSVLYISACHVSGFPQSVQCVSIEQSEGFIEPSGVKSITFFSDIFVVLVQLAHEVFSACRPQLVVIEH